MRTLLASLIDHSLVMLRGIAELRGVELAGNARGEVAAQLATALGETESTCAALAACSPAAQSAWQAARAANGRIKATVFAREYGEIRPIGPGKLERDETWRQPATPAEELWYRGLIFRAFADLGDGPLEYIYIPEDLPLPPPQPSAGPKPAIAVLPPAPQAPLHAHQTFNTLAVDVCATLAVIREAPLPLDGAAALVPSSAAHLLAHLVFPDEKRLSFLLALARANGWLSVDRERLVVDHQRAGGWLRATPWQQMSSLFTAWRDSVNWNDLRHVPGLLAEGEWHNDPLLPRRALLAILKQLDVKSWRLTADLISYVKTTQPDFQRPTGAYSGWYLRDAASGQFLSGFESWEHVEGRLLQFLIEGPLFWLGAVALGEWVAGEPRAFRLTAFGAAWLTSRLPRTLPHSAQLAIGDDFVVAAPLFTPLLDRFRLLRITEPLPMRAGAPGHVAERLSNTRHRITRASLARAREEGIKAEAALDFLKRAAGGRIPQKVAVALLRFDELGGAVRLTRGAILRVDDAATLSTLRADPVIGPLLGELISAQALLVPEANLERLQAVLKDSGYKVHLE